MTRENTYTFSFNKENVRKAIRGGDFNFWQYRVEPWFGFPRHGRP